VLGSSGTRAGADRLVVTQAYTIADREFSIPLGTPGIKWGCRKATVSWPRSIGMDVRKIIRILGVSLTLVGLLVSGTAAVSHWHSQSSGTEAQCQYCHVGRLTAVQPGIGQWVGALLLIGLLPLPEDFSPSVSPVLLLTAPRAPPLA
jgi:hypothetical protein